MKNYFTINEVMSNLDLLKNRFLIYKSNYMLLITYFYKIDNKYVYICRSQYSNNKIKEYFFKKHKKDLRVWFKLFNYDLIKLF